MLANTPSIAEVIAIVRKLTDSEERWERFSGGAVDWVTALILEPNAAPKRFTWRVVHVESEKHRSQVPLTQIWQSANSEWHALAEEEEMDSFQLVVL